LILAAVFAGLVLLFCRRLVGSPFGRVLKALREDEVFALAAGKNVAFYKVLVFVLGAAMASVAGALYATYITFIDPTSFTVMESIFIISVVIIGGAGSLWGPVLGAVVLVSLPELLRFVGLPSSVAANVRQMLYGGLLVVFMMWRPQGLLGEFSFRKGDQT
jgi:branched-chain amino acid transport system permease protein